MTENQGKQQNEHWGDSAESAWQLLRSEPEFARWALAETLSVVASMVYSWVIPMLTYALTGSRTHAAFVFALRVIMYLVFGLLAGPVADRWNRKLLIVGGNIVEGVLVASLPIAAIFDAVTLPHIYIVVVLAATTFVFSDAAVMGALPTLVGAHRLPAANGALASLMAIAEISGPIVGGILVGTAGAARALWFVAAALVSAGLVQIGIKKSLDPETRHTDGGALRHMKHAVRFILDHKVLPVTITTGALYAFSIGATFGVLVIYGVDQLGLEHEDSRFGIIYSLMGIGTLISGLAFDKIYSARRLRWIAPLTLCMVSLGMALLSITTSWKIAGVLYLLESLWAMTFLSSVITYRQMVSPDEIRSSIGVVGRMVAWGGEPLGVIVAGFVATYYGISTAFVMGATVAFVATVFSLVFLRHGTEVEPAATCPEETC